MQKKTHLTEHSGREQTRIAYLVDTFPHFERQTLFPPSCILLFADDAALQKQKEGPLFSATFKHPNVKLSKTHFNQQKRFTQYKVTPFSYSFMERSQSKQFFLES